MNRIKNAGKNMSIMLTGVAIGAVLAGGSIAAAAGVVAEPTWQPIFVDGRQIQMTAYNIAGHNYVKLRDIGEKVGFNVYWSDGVQVPPPIQTDCERCGIPSQHSSSAPAWAPTR